MKGAVAQFTILLALSIAKAEALSLELFLYEPRQIGKTENAEVGLVVRAATPAYSLSVAGGYTVTCPDSQVIEAQTSASEWRLFGNVSFWVNVPVTPPGQYPMTGWNSWPSPSNHSCSFRYVGRAKDGVFAIGGFGSNISFGGGDKSQGDTKIFKMVKPPPGTDAGPGTCIPIRLP